MRMVVTVMMMVLSGENSSYCDGDGGEWSKWC